MPPSKNPEPSAETRCRWATREPNISYHDEEWGVPVHDDRTWFEFITLEGAQAGLSWETILKKRERYRKVFSNFDPEKSRPLRREEKEIADGRSRHHPQSPENRFHDHQRASLPQNPKRIRHFDNYIWSFVEGKPLQSNLQPSSKMIVSTKVSDAISKDLKKRGFRFVGTTIIYALMQATGLVNDHTADCYRYRSLSRSAK